MACPHTLFSMEFEMTLTSPDDIWRPLGGPVVIAGASGFDLLVTLRTVSGNARVIAAWQPIAARPNAGGTVTAAAGSYTSTVTSTKNTIDTSGVNDKFLAQLGVLGNLTTGTTPAYVTGVLTARVSRCMKMLGERRIQASGSSTNANPDMYLLGRVPAANASELRAALVADGMKDMEYRFFVRGCLDPETPGAWVALNSGYTGFTDGNSAVCHSDTAVSTVIPANWHDLEFAIALRMKSGGTAPSGFLRVLAALSYT